MPMRLIPDGTMIKEIRGVRFEIATPTNGQMFRIAQLVSAIRDEAIIADMDGLMLALAPLIMSIDGEQHDISRKLIRWADFKGQFELIKFIMNMVHLTDAEEKNSGSSPAGSRSGQPATELSNTAISAETAGDASATPNG